VETHCGSVAGEPPGESESDEGREPGLGTRLVISQRAMSSRARATVAGSKKTAGLASPGIGSASSGKRNGNA